MVNEKVDKERKSGLFSALRELFSSGEERLNEEDQKAIKALEDESASRIKSLEDTIMSNKEPNRKNLVEGLKVKRTTVPEGVNKNAKNQKEKKDDLVK